MREAAAAVRRRRGAEGPAAGERALTIRPRCSDTAPGRRYPLGPAARNGTRRPMGEQDAPEEPPTSAARANGTRRARDVSESAAAAPPAGCTN